MSRQFKTVPDEALRRAQGILSGWRVPPEFLNSIMERRSPVTFAKGEAIFTRGSAGDVAYWILSGLVKVYYPLEDGSRVIVHVAGAGDFIGVADAIGTNKRRVQAFEAEGMTKVCLAIFTRDHVVSMLKTMPPTALVELLEDVNTTWSELFSRSAKFLGLSFRDRLLWVFEHLANRYGVRDARGVLLTLDLSHDDLAEMIASSRPMVSRLIAEFMEQGELDRQGRRYILINQGKGDLSRPLLRASETKESLAHKRPILNLAYRKSKGETELALAARNGS